MSYSIGRKSKINLAEKDSEILRFFASVEFGVLSKNCKNYGICRLNPLGVGIQEVKKKNGCKPANCIASVTYYNEQQLKLEFQESRIKPADKKKYFDSGYFIVEENFSTTFCLGENHAEKHITVRKGKYRVKEAGRMLTVKFS